MAMLSRLTCALLLVLVPACSSTTSDPAAQPAPAPEGENARLDVSNRSSFDMDVFAIRIGQRIRLGTAPGGETSRFTLSPGREGRVRVESVSPGVSSPAGSRRFRTPKPIHASEAGVSGR